MSLSQSEITVLINLSRAHGVRSRMRELAKTAKDTVQQTQCEVVKWGLFDECDFDRRKAASNLDASVILKIKAEKHFKALKEEAVERHPAVWAAFESFLMARPEVAEQVSDAPSS